MRRCKNCGSEIDDDTYLYNEGYCNTCVKEIRADQKETEDRKFEEEQEDWDEFLTTEEEWEDEE